MSKLWSPVSEQICYNPIQAFICVISLLYILNILKSGYFFLFWIVFTLYFTIQIITYLVGTMVAKETPIPSLKIEP